MILELPENKDVLKKGWERQKDVRINLKELLMSEVGIK